MLLEFVVVHAVTLFTAITINKAKRLERFLQLDPTFYANRDIKSYDITIRAPRYVVWDFVENYDHFPLESDILEDLFSDQEIEHPKRRKRKEKKQTQALSKISVLGSLEKTICTENLRSGREIKKDPSDTKNSNLPSTYSRNIRCALCMLWSMYPRTSGSIESTRVSITFYLSPPIIGGKELGKFLFKDDSISSKMFRMGLNDILTANRGHLISLADKIVDWVKQSSENTANRRDIAAKDAKESDNEVYTDNSSRVVHGSFPSTEKVQEMASSTWTQVKSAVNILHAQGGHTEARNSPDEGSTLSISSPTKIFLEWNRRRKSTESNSDIGPTSGQQRNFDPISIPAETEALDENKNKWKPEKGEASVANLISPQSSEQISLRRKGEDENTAQSSILSALSSKDVSKPVPLSQLEHKGETKTMKPSSKLFTILPSFSFPLSPSVTKDEEKAKRSPILTTWSILGHKARKLTSNNNKHSLPNEEKADIRQDAESRRCLLVLSICLLLLYNIYLCACR